MLHVIVSCDTPDCTALEKLPLGKRLYFTTFRKLAHRKGWTLWRDSKRRKGRQIQDVCPSCTRKDRVPKHWRRLSRSMEELCAP